MLTETSCYLHGRRHAEFVGNEIWPPPTSGFDATAVGRQCAHRDVGMPNLSGTKYSCYPHHSVTIASRSPPTSGSNAIAVGRQCVAMASNVTIASRSPPTSEIYSFGTSMCPQVMLRNNITQMETLLP